MKSKEMAIQASSTPVTAKKELSAHDLAYFFEQLSIFSKSGIATWECLAIISENLQVKHNKTLFFDLYDSVVSGATLSHSMKQANCFPAYAIGMLEVGERTGRIEEASAALHSYYQSKDRLSQSIRSSVTYPLCMAGMILVVIFVLLVQVMPVFEQVFTQLGLALNSVSQFLLDLGQLLSEYTVYVLIVLAVFLLIFIVMRLVPGGKKALLKMYDTFPLTRRLSQSEGANHFAFSMALMLGSGIDALYALEFSMMITKSPTVRKKIAFIIKRIEDGDSLTNAIIDSRIFSPMYNGMVEAGMRSGTVSEMMMSVAERYFEDTQKLTQKLLSIIEPTLVAILCLMVGMVMLSVMLPLTGILAGI